MPSLTVTSKGQITLRRELLQYLGIAPGQQVQIDRLANGVLALHAKPTQNMQGFVGCLPPPAKALSLDDMDQLVASAWAARA